MAVWIVGKGWQRKRGKQTGRDDGVDRREVAERAKHCTYDELAEWKRHVLFCLKWHTRDNNQYEIDECQYVLGVIEEQMARLTGK